MLSFEKVNSILVTLPVGYYLGRRINCELEDSDQSYHDPFNDLIVIGFKQLPCVEIEGDLDDEEIEKDIRCMLYHEISHVLATPKEMSHFYVSDIADRAFSMATHTSIESSAKAKNYKRRINDFNEKDVHDILNIFEDQRIETIFGSYFKNVDFPNYVKKVNHYEGPTKPVDTFDAFYQIVRFNDGPKEFVKRVYNIIKDFTVVKGYDQANRYFAKVMILFLDIQDYYKMDAKCEERIASEAGAPTKITIKLGSSKDTPDIEMPDALDIDLNNVEIEIEDTDKEEGDGEDSPAHHDTSKETSEKSKEIEDDKSKISKEDLEKLLDAIKDYLVRCKKSIIDEDIKADYKNEPLDNKVKTIILNARRKKGLTASSTQTHFGKLNPKYVGRKRIEDYKWFDKSLDGEKNSSSKIQLNLFVDISGSFSGSQQKINELLYSLNELQKRNKDFTCRLVTMGNENILRDRVSAVICREGNYLKNEIIDIYKKVQNKNATNYNIAVFDGDAQSFDGISSWSARERMRKTHEKAWSAWNHPNCVIISDPSNQREFDKWSPIAKRIYTYDYVSKLEDNIIKALEMLFK